MEPAIQYEVLTDWREIPSLCAEWNVLLAHSCCNRAFNPSQWYSAVPLILPELSAFLCIARRSGTLQGIFPLWLDRRQQEVGFAGDFGDHPDIIAAQDDLDVITDLLAFAIRAAAAHGKLLLKRIKPDSNFVRAASALGFSCLIEEGFAAETAREYAVIDLGMGYETYLKSLSRKFRLNLNRMRHKASADGVILRELQPENFDPQLLPATFLSLHSARFGEASKLVAPHAVGWIHRLFPSLFAERRLRVFAVLLGDRIAAIDLAMVGSSGLYAWNGGFSPDVEQSNAGKLLIDKTIEQYCAEGLAEYDIGWFRQQYKAHWKPTIRRIGTLQFDGRQHQAINIIAAPQQRT